MESSLEKVKNLIIESEKRVELLRKDREKCEQFESKEAIIKVINYHNEMIYDLERIAEKLTKDK